jgi:hypothetical protein
MTAIPDLDFPPPFCPECDTECTYEGGWECAPCQIVWSPDGTRGERCP